MALRVAHIAVVAAVVAALGSSAAIPGVVAAAPVDVSRQVFAGFTMNGNPATCRVEAAGIRVCAGDVDVATNADGRFKSFDGAPLAFFVTLPAKPTRRPDGRFPLVVQSHGWGAPPSSIDDTQYGGPSARTWAKAGYAVLQFDARGWGTSCGTPESRLVNPTACATGYLHMVDPRFEVRDIQYAVGALVDAGIAHPRKIGAVGESYGAGTSLALASLRNRIMLADGQVSPWRSPRGVPISLAAAAPLAGWTDLANSLMPNGRSLDHGIAQVMASTQPFGVLKATIMSGLYAVGASGAYYAPPGVDAKSSQTQWYAEVMKGEPYDNPLDQQMAAEISQFHSPYSILAGAYGVKRIKPAPLIWAQGFTDDVFPVVETLRYYNLAKRLYPRSHFSVWFGDIGHQRGQNKPFTAAQSETFRARFDIKRYFDFYLKGIGRRPRDGFTVTTQTCGEGVPFEGPLWSRTWAGLHPKTVQFTSAPTQTVISSVGDPTVGQAFDPVAGGLACTTASGADQPAGVATYRLPPAEGSGYLMVGSPTVTANLTVTGVSAYLSARLLDVDPATGKETLVARGTYRIDPAQPNGVQSFQLNANGWRFANGHIPKLELLGGDAPYSRPANGAFTIDVSDLALVLPTH